jgi:glucose-6-phosphate dehydrogenase assembly protein OpcA
MIGVSRSAPYRGAMSVEEIERELARLRMNEDGTLGARSSVVNLIAVTDEEFATSVARLVSKLSERYPSRAILIISDPREEEVNLDIWLSAFCGIRGGAGGGEVCAEQITIHVEGPPAEHLESLAGSLLIPDLPVFLWYPNEIPRLLEHGMTTLADRLILDSGAAGDCESSLREVANRLEKDNVPAVGDLQWAALSPWRSLVADLFTPQERVKELEKIQHVEIVQGADGGCQALLFAAWLSSVLGWRPETAERTRGGRVFRFAGPSARVTVECASNALRGALGQVRLISEDLTFQVSRREERASACSTVMRGDEPVGERTVYLRSSGVDVLLGEELRLAGRDETYESALKRVVEMLNL